MLSWIFIMLTHWNKSPWVDMSLYSDTLSWEPISLRCSYSLIMWGSNPRSTAKLTSLFFSHFNNHFLLLPMKCKPQLFSRKTWRYLFISFLDILFYLFQTFSFVGVVSYVLFALSVTMTFSCCIKGPKAVDCDNITEIMLNTINQDMIVLQTTII
jgi:hypothetical protein